MTVEFAEKAKKDEKILVTVLHIAHRREVYK